MDCIWEGRRPTWTSIIAKADSTVLWKFEGSNGMSLIAAVIVEVVRVTGGAMNDSGVALLG